MKCDYQDRDELLNESILMYGAAKVVEKEDAGPLYKMIARLKKAKANLHKQYSERKSLPAIGCMHLDAEDLKKV